MKLIMAIGLISFSIITSANHHLPLEMTFSEYQELYQTLKQAKNNRITDSNVRDSINGGEKMSEWIKKINSIRTPENSIRLTSKATQRGIPIDKPSKYGPSTIKTQLNELKLNMPVELSEVIFGKKGFSNNTILSDEIFVNWCRKVSRLYQSAVRWTGMQRWLEHYAKRKTKDVRGYYYLKNLENLDQTLRDYPNLSSEEVLRINNALVGICINSETSKKNCEKKLLEVIAKSKLIEFKNTFWKKATRNWNSFFVITDPRKDVSWTKSSLGVMGIVFKDPKNEIIANWLKTNIEDEFKFSPENWVMEMRFISGNYSTAHLEFQKNVTPHVSGGNKIVMDANTELEEYGVKWTIRHEYGHILRLPDCYHEFYDKEQNLMINYQLDTSDLMCSRVGAMNERIYNELKKVYLK